MCSALLTSLWEFSEDNNSSAWISRVVLFALMWKAAHFQDCKSHLLVTVAQYCELFVLGVTLALQTQPVTCIRTSAKCKYATAGPVYWELKHIDAGFSLCLSHSLILNLSLPFWSRFVYQPTCYFYRRPLLAQTQFTIEKDVSSSARVSPGMVKRRNTRDKQMFFSDVSQTRNPPRWSLSWGLATYVKNAEIGCVFLLKAEAQR